MANIQIKRPLWVKITGYGFGAVLFTSAAIGGLAWYSETKMAEDALFTKAESDLALIRDNMDAIRASATAIAAQAAADGETADILTAKDHQRALAKFGAGFEALKTYGGLPLFTVIDADGHVLARTHAPDRFGDDLAERRPTAQSALSSGNVVSGIERSRTGGIGMYAVAPVTVDGRVVGAIDVGTYLADDYFDAMSAKLGSEVSVNVMVDGILKTQTSTQNDKPLLTPEDLQAGFDGETVFKQINLQGRDIVVKVVPFTDFTGNKIGVFEIGADATEIVAAGAATLRNTIIGSLIVAVISLAFFLAFARSLGGSISGLTGTMSRLASGDLDAEVQGETRPDEIGAMARAVQVFKDNALKNRALEQEAEDQRNQTEEQRRITADQERIRTEAMAQATGGLANGLQQLAAGNLSVQLSQSFAEEFESLRADFNQAVSQLRETMSGVAEATGSIDSGAREVSQSADDLSKRTEQQAASLEETAAALDQITTNVSNSSKRAEEARVVAIQANDSTRQSGAVMTSAVDAMGKIEQSSNQISSIIGVIDDIAFQTNLLALNAGVEAARAGEAGKGFAVVAQEVRELAQRSATAAKEIKELIRNSSIEVENGVRLVSETGEALKTIETYIVTINQHMDAIATSSREQSVGLSEVNTAVNQMDQVTQQNAAMVEEANAAGATLANEAGRMRDLVSQFQLGGTATQSAPRRTAPVVASAQASSAPSPARGMVNKIARAFTGRGSAAPAVNNDWEEF